MSIPMVRTRTPAELALDAAFKAVDHAGSTAATRLRRAAFDTFAKAGLPHRRIEDWHYTDLRRAMGEALPLAPAPDASVIAHARRQVEALDVSGCRLVVVDGAFVAELSTPVPAGVTIRRLADVLRTEDAASLGLVSGLHRNDVGLALNAAFMTDGVVLDIAPGTTVSETINIICVDAASTPSARFTRSAVRVGAGASVRVAEWSLDEARVARQTFNCLLLDIADEARVHHTIFVPDASPESVRFEAQAAVMGARAHLGSVAGLFGGGLVRRQIALRLEGADATAMLDGIALLGARAHADTTMFVEHLATGGTSRDVFRHVLADEATGVFQGKIHVAPEAQGTDGKMLSRALLLSDGATMNNKPELEIFADDVACGHGATCGGLNEDQLFYLQARGLPRAEAEALLLEGFAGEVADTIDEPALTAKFRAAIANWLAGRSAR